MFPFYAARVGAYPSRAANHGTGLERVNVIYGKLPIRLRQMPKFLFKYILCRVSSNPFVSLRLCARQPALRIDIYHHCCAEWVTSMHLDA
jgi:hypothetical protein